MSANHKSEGCVPTVTPLLTAPQIATTRVVIALPWLKHTNPLTAFSVMGLVDRRRTGLMLNYGDAFVAHSRNKCADHFLQSPFDWLLMLDDDMIVPFGDAAWFKNNTGFDFLSDRFAGLNALDRLLSHGKTLVGALYFGRQHFGAPMYCEGASQATEAEFARRGPHELLKPTRWVATGCMLIHRRVFEDIEKKFPRLARGQNKMGGQWFTSSEHHAMDLIDRVRKLCSEGSMTAEKGFKAFEMLEAGAELCRRQSSLAMGEDVAFCVRAAEAGHQPFVDMGLLCGHVGACCFGPRNTFPKPR